MIKMQWRGKKDLYRSLVRIETKIDKGAGEFTNEAGHWLSSNIRKNWSGTAPSMIGKPPAVRTGNLDSSIFVEGGRDTKGRFATGDAAKVTFVRINTSEGSNPKKRGNYAHILEKKLKRPFVTPAIERLRARFPSLAKEKIRP